MMCFWLICESNLKPHGECLACKHPRACACMEVMYVLYSKFDPIQEIDPKLKVYRHWILFCKAIAIANKFRLSSYPENI